MAAGIRRPHAGYDQPERWSGLREIARGIELPFGGVKKSGHGREKGLEALHEFSHTKTIVFKHG